MPPLGVEAALRPSLDRELVERLLQAALDSSVAIPMLLTILGTSFLGSAGSTPSHCEVVVLVGGELVACCGFETGDGALLGALTSLWVSPELLELTVSITG